MACAEAPVCAFLPDAFKSGSAAAIYGCVWVHVTCHGSALHPDWLGHVSGSQDLLSNPLIVPVKILRGHERVNHEGVLGVAFHPSQPWLFTAGADASICLFTNP